MKNRNPKSVLRFSLFFFAFTIVSVAVAWTVGLFMNHVGLSLFALLALSGPASFLFPIFSLNEFNPRADYFLIFYLVTSSVIIFFFQKKFPDSIFYKLVKAILIAFVWLLSGLIALYLIGHFE